MTIDTQHTPGPWSTDIYTLDIYTSGNQGLRCGDSVKSVMNINARGDIAEISNCNPFQTDDERIANARLITAAPELLEALEWLYEIAQSDKKSGPYMTKAKYAIAKAKGQS